MVIKTIFSTVKTGGTIHIRTKNQVNRHSGTAAQESDLAVLTSKISSLGSMQKLHPKQEPIQTR